MTGAYNRTAVKQQWNVRTIRIALAILMAILLSAGIYITGLVLERQSALERLSRYNVAFSAGQGANEFLRLRTALYSLALNPESTDAARNARLRFEILMNRLNLFESGEFDGFTKSQPDIQQLVDQIENTLVEIDPLIGAPGEASTALALTAPLEASFVEILSKANAYGGRLVARDQQELFGLHWQFTTVAIALALCGFVLFLFNGWQNRLLISAQRSLAGSNEDLQRASARLAASVAETRDANTKLVRQNELFETALDNMSHGLCMFNRDGNIIVTNRRMAEIFGLPATSIRHGTTLAEFEDVLHQVGLCSPRGAARLLRMRSGPAESMARHTAEQTLADGRRVMVSHQPMDSGGWTATFEDITDRYKAQAQISHMARHDALTNLPNRTLLRERLEATLARDRATQQIAAVMCIDLDNFKKINDTYGHPFGDQLLCEASARLLSVCRNKDTISRIGGDEFIVVCSGMERMDQVDKAAKRMVQALSEPFHIQGREVTTGGSIGIATTRQASDSVDELLRFADLALYSAKDAGRGTYAHYTAEMGAQIERKVVVESRLRAEDLGEDFALAFQPITSLASKRMTCVEALLRWKNPSRGTTEIPEVIRIAEESGAIVNLGAWVLREACLFAAQLPDEICMAVNISAVQFNRTDIVKTVSDILKETKLPAGRLVLEITETLLLEDNTKITTEFKALKELGVSLSLDDFGTGYSSLNYLRKFAVDTIKIDRVFIKEIGRNRDHDAIVATIINLASNLGMTTIAEGVETEDQLQILRAAGCTEIQGFLVGRPMPKDALDRYIKDLPENGVLPLREEASGSLSSGSHGASRSRR